MWLSAWLSTGLAIMLSRSPQGSDLHGWCGAGGTRTHDRGIMSPVL
jgi:hypothetical protein